jgi:hypothetical protein
LKNSIYLVSVLSIDFLVMSEIGQFSSARILKENSTIAILERRPSGDVILQSNEGNFWKISQKVDGEYRPFSSVVTLEGTGSGPIETGPVVLKIRDHLFSHNGKMYMLSNIPEDKHQHHVLRGPKFISRLDNFPYDDPSKVDPETRYRLRRHRGIQVGEISGIGHSGHKVSLNSELADIGLLLAACAFLLFTTHGVRIHVSN